MPLINVRQRKRELRARYKKLRAECDPALKRKLDEQAKKSAKKGHHNKPGSFEQRRQEKISEVT